MALFRTFSLAVTGKFQSFLGGKWAWNEFLGVSSSILFSSLSAASSSHQRCPHQWTPPTIFRRRLRRDSPPLLCPVRRFHCDGRTTLPMRTDSESKGHSPLRDLGLPSRRCHPILFRT